MSISTCTTRVGAALRERRRLLRLTQAEVAELAGTTQRSVSLAESGRASGLALYGEIADVLGLQIVARPAPAPVAGREAVGVRGQDGAPS